MKLISRIHRGLFRALRIPHLSRPTKLRFAIGSTVAALALLAVTAIAPAAPPSAAERLRAYLDAHAQTMTLSKKAATPAVLRDNYESTPGVDTFKSGGTNYDWAKLVLVDGGWPLTDANVTVLLRWMRQENGADDWWNRNNPMNNGYGSGGGGGTGSYDNLVTAAQKIVEMLRHNSAFNDIIAGFESGTSSEATEQAIWASPWASGHYGDGSRWHYTPVAQVKAPESAWG